MTTKQSANTVSKHIEQYRRTCNHITMQRIGNTLHSREHWDVPNHETGKWDRFSCADINVSYHTCERV